MYNKAQEEAINANSNVVIVIAGAGSGKTTVLTERITRLINEGVSPHNILAITFTNKAASEMKSRLLENLGPYAFAANVSTFHALAVRIIRENAEHLQNHDRYFVILDSEDQKKIIKRIIDKYNYDYKVPEVMGNISYAKSRSLTYKNIENLIQDDYKVIYDEYHKYMQENNAFDFDDLLLVTYELLKDKEIRRKYNELFKYIHVDEFQDTSMIQGEILKKLKSPENTLFIVGDVDQSIYTWRGATIDNLLNLQDEYDNSELIKLEQNYRSTQNILNGANRLIDNNKKRFEKTLWTENKKGPEISYYEVNTASDEANTIIREINSVVDYGADYSEFAVLYRYNYQSRKVEEALMKSRIPYKIYGGIRFYERMEIKDILAYLRLFMNPSDNISLTRIINTPKRKVGAKTLEKLENYAEDNQLSLYEAMGEIGNKEMKKLYNLIKKYQPLMGTVDPQDFDTKFKLFLEELRYREYLLTQDDTNKVEDRMNNIQELKEGFIQELELGNSIQDYILEISVLGNSDVEEDDDAVVLSTIHGAKGLEFDNVFVAGLIEGKFPKENAFYNSDEMEEERRLAYVAITRAKRTLTLLSYRFDFRYEELERSRFIEESGIEVNQGSELTDFIF